MLATLGLLGIEIVTTWRAGAEHRKCAYEVKVGDLYDVSNNPPVTVTITRIERAAVAYTADNGTPVLATLLYDDHRGRVVMIFPCGNFKCSDSRCNPAIAP